MVKGRSGGAWLVVVAVAMLVSALDPRSVRAEDAESHNWSWWFREARASSKRGDHAGATEAYAKAIEAAQESSADPDEAGKDIAELARLLLAWGRSAEACEVYGNLVESAAGRHGESATEVLAPLRAQIEGCIRTPRADEVPALTERYLEIVETRRASMTPEALEGAVLGLVEAFDRQARMDLLLDQDARILAIAEAGFTDVDARVAGLYDQFAAAHVGRGGEHLARAAELRVQAVSAWTELRGEQSVEVARSLVGLGRAQGMLDQLDASEETLEHAIALLEELDEANLLAQALAQLGSIYWSQGRIDEAKALRQRSAELRESSTARTRSRRVSGSPAAPGGRAALPTLASRKRVESEARAALLRNRISDLDAIEQTLREDDVRDESGRGLLQAFYRGILPPPNADLGGFWRVTLGKIKEWERVQPESVAAVIAEGEYWMQYGWRVRGSRRASEVGEAETDIFQQHLAKARKVLEDLGERGRVSPHWYQVMLMIGRGQGWTDDEHRELFEEGIGRFPDDLGLYVQRGVYLSPFWYGSWARVSDLAAWSSNEDRGGESMYARVYWGVFRGVRRPHQVFEPGSANWERLESSFHALIAKYPSAWNRHALSYYACLAEDREATRRALEGLGTTGPYEIWGRSRFEECRTWASGGDQDE